MDEILHGVISEGNFDRCKRKLVVACVLQGVLDVVCKLVCPKDPTYYKLKSKESCNEFEKVDFDSLHHNILAKICKILILANQSENVCKILTNVGLVFKDCIQGEFIEEVCDAVGVLEGETGEAPECQLTRITLCEYAVPSENVIAIAIENGVNTAIDAYNVNGDCETLINSIEEVLNEDDNYVTLEGAKSPITCGDNAGPGAGTNGEILNPNNSLLEVITFLQTNIEECCNGETFTIPT
jgi:hypothetical protein